MRTLKNIVVGIAIVAAIAIAMVTFIPVAIVSAIITIRLTLLAIGVILTLAIAWWLFAIPTTTVAGLTGNRRNPRFLAGGFAITLAVIVGFMAIAQVRGNEAKAESAAQQQADIEAGRLLDCTHPDLSPGLDSMTFPADMLKTSLAHGWTCTTNGRTYRP